MGVQEAGKQATVPLFLLPEKKLFHLLQKGIDLSLKLKLFWGGGTGGRGHTTKPTNKKPSPTPQARV